MLNARMSDWRFDKVAIPAATFATLEAVDGLMTVWAMKHGFVEINFLTAPIAGSWMFPVIKIALALIGIGVLIPMAKRFPRMVNIGFNSTSAFLIVILASNIFEILK